MTKPLADRIAVVTGASSGMGRAHAEVLAERGAHVIVQDIREERAGTVADAIRSAGGSAEAMGGDASDVPDFARVPRCSITSATFEISFSRALAPSLNQQWRQPRSRFPRNRRATWLG